MHRVMITGASSEIGMAIAGRLIDKADHLLLHYYRNQAPCLSFKERSGEKCALISANLTDPVALEGLCGQLGDVDTVINAAGITQTGLLPTLTEAAIRQMLEVNILATTMICRSVIPGMVDRRCGCIVNISSVTATRASRGQTIYAGTKGFIESFTRAMAAEYGSRGIRVNCIAPGPIDSGSLRELLSIAPDEVKRSVAANRLGTPADVASVVAFVCSHEADYINGQTLHVDGGFMVGV
jgi:3-oxoacyl-[acyl-carrier protein] reductase